MGISSETHPHLVNWFRDDPVFGRDVYPAIARILSRDFLDIYFGKYDDPEAFARAVTILSSDDENGVIGSMIGGSLGGLVFNPFRKSAVERVIRIKSAGGVARHELFSVVAPLSVFESLRDPDQAQSRPYGKLAEACFVRVPVSGDISGIIPREFIASADGQRLMQFFLAGEGTPLSKLLSHVCTDYPIQVLGGSSANFSTWGSIGNELRSVQFFFIQPEPVFFLQLPPSGAEARKGSFPILECIGQKIRLVREGNRTLDELTRLLTD